MQPGASPVLAAALSRTAALAAALTFALVPGTAAAQAGPGVDGTFVIEHASVWTGTGAPLENVNVVIRDGRIAAVGAGATAPNATVIDARGKWVYPGMINAYTPLGLAEIGGIATMNLRSELGEYNPHMRAAVALNVDSRMLGVTRANGVTNAISAPSGGVISGQAALINTAGWTTEDLAIVPSAAFIVNFPREPSANARGRGRGAGSDESSALTPQQRYDAEVRDLHRVLATAKQYAAQRTGGSQDVDLMFESMRPLMAGDVPALVSADTETQIRGAILLADSFGIKVIINGGEEAWKVRSLLAEHRIPVVLGSIESLPGADLPYDAIYAQPGLLVDAGVRIAFSTGDAASARHVPFHAALAVAYGLSKDDAMKALTVWPAEMFGASDQIGTIEVGKMANLFVTTGDPLDVRSQVEALFIRGRHVPMDDAHTRLYEKYNARPANPSGRPPASQPDEPPE
jgi:imidazolonepropionase-like amidohydrolase